MDKFKLKFIAWLGVGIYLILVIAGFWLLHISSSGARLTTPWQTIDHRYIYVFAGATFTLALLIVFSRLKSSNLLILLIFHSLLLHSYLPLTHELSYGADGWRHMANEERILAGKPYLEPKLSSRPQEGSLAHQTTDRDSPMRDRETSFVVGMTSAIGRLSYSQLWFLSVAVADYFHLDLITINKWLMPIVWSLFFPLLLYEVGKTLGWSERRSLFLVWISALPFALQSAGAFTLPVNLGVIFWLLFFLSLLKRADKPSTRQVSFLLFGAVALLFGYSLFFLLFGMAWGVTELVGYWHRNGRLSGAIIIAIGIVSALFFSLIEAAAKYSYIDLGVQWTRQAQQFLGNFSGWYLANGPRPHDIATGNIIFNQIPSYSFVANLFTEWRQWVVLFMLTFWGVVVFGARELIRSKKNSAYVVLFMTGGLTGSYILSRYFLSGEEVLTRRLDVVLAFFFVILFTAGLFKLFERFGRQPSIPRLGGVGVGETGEWPIGAASSPTPGREAFPAQAGNFDACFRGSEKRQKLVLVLTIAILTIAIAASYSLGPDTNTVSLDEYHAMQYVWSNDQANGEHCVVGETYPLLALEAISKKEIIGGGFPIDANFGQPELAKSYQALTANPSFAVWENILDKRKMNECWLVASRANLHYNTFITQESEQIRYFGDTLVWWYTGPSESLKTR
ncbi:MAG: hypothetical protein EXS55_03640 [Candidatus Magasanikbacteria bacterium]|nr:hypothetical protein [Candidatus Magasanikbacteria bacterium]